MKKTLLFFLFFFVLRFAFSQEVPLYIHTYNNLYLQNPSMAGLGGHGEIYLTAHKQVIADRPDAPQYGTISYNAPIKKSRSAIGFTANYFKRSFLNTGGASATFAHRIDFDEHQHVRFGLSLGFTSNNLDVSLLDDVDDQAAYQKYFKKNTTINGQFGISYQLKKFNLGLALPKLFNKYVADSASNKGIYAFRNYTFMASYKFNLSADITFQPLVYFRSSQYVPAQVEGNGTINYKELIWAGATYRQDYGTAVILGVRMQSISLAYAYKVPSAKQYNYANPAHEIQLAFHFKSTPKIIADNTEQQKVDSLTVKNLPEPDNSEPDVRIATKEGDHPLELEVNHYVVVGSFKYQDNAEKLISQLKSKKIEGKLGYNSTNLRFYVYTYNSKDYNQALENYKILRKHPGFEDTWILKIIQEN